jgi:predicted GIY-YIG superfamily endonuclease
MIYVLLLEENKFYVGYSERPVGERFIEHFNYQGSKWTTLHRPVQVLQVKPGGIEEENEMTLRRT